MAATNWDDATVNSTAWSDTTTTSTAWGPVVLEQGFLLLETGDAILQEDSYKFIWTRGE